MRTPESLLTLILLSTLIFLSFPSLMAIPESKKASITLTATTRHEPAMYNTFEDAFTQAHPELDVDIEWLEITTNTGWVKALQSTTYTVDFCWGGGPTVFTLIADEGLLNPMEDPDLVQHVENEIPNSIADIPMNQ